MEQPRDLKGKFLKGNHYNIGTEFKKNQTPWNKGIFLPDFVIRKMSESKKGEKHYNFGKHLSEETKKKIGESNRGHPQSNTGSTHFKKGMTAWNKGLKGYFAGEKNSMYGKHHSEETIQKQREAKLGSKNPNWGKPRSDYQRKRASETHKG
ncbi:MAG: NUMOD3 domain-containing DNA-binding protein, partial [Nanoarchaeota archaeon]